MNNGENISAPQAVAYLEGGTGVHVSPPQGGENEKRKWIWCDDQFFNIYDASARIWICVLA